MNAPHMNLEALYHAKIDARQRVILSAYDVALRRRELAQALRTEQMALDAQRAADLAWIAAVGVEQGAEAASVERAAASDYEILMGDDA